MPAETAAPEGNGRVGLTYWPKTAPTPACRSFHVRLLSASLITHPGITGFVILLWAALAATTGSAFRSHRAYVAEVEMRARRAEQAREDEVNRRVAEERLRIARELHDAVGHHVALINVRAGEEALEDLRLTVGLLRELGAAELAEPVPGLDQLGELICSFAGTGLQVCFRRPPPGALSPGARQLTLSPRATSPAVSYRVAASRPDPHRHARHRSLPEETA